MSRYWRKKMDELNEENKKSSRTTSKTSGTSATSKSNSSSDYWQGKMDELNEANKKKKLAEKQRERDKKNKELLSLGRGPIKDTSVDDDILPVRKYGTRVFEKPEGGIGSTRFVDIVAPATADRSTLSSTIANRKLDEQQAITKSLFKTRLEEREKAKVTDAEAASMYANYKKLQEDRENKTGRFADEEEKERTWFQANAFKDGYDFGDVSKTVGGTLGDIGVNLVQGAGSMVEGIIDFGAFMVAKDIENHLSTPPLILRGKEKEQLEAREKLQSVAGDIRDFAKTDLVGDTLAPAKDFLDKGSLLGDKSDSVSQGLGQIAGMYFTGGLGELAGLGSAGASALTTGSMFFSSAGQGISEAYGSGASDNEAMAYGMLSGIAEAGSELIFGGLGKGVNALGVSRGLSSLDDMFAKKLSDGISSQVVKNFVEFGVKSSAEGLEEVLAGLGTAAAQKLTYMSDEELSKLIEDQDLFEQFIVGTVTSSLAQSGYIPGTKNGSLRESNKTGRDFITGYTQSEQSVIDRELADRIAELEKDGEKLSEKDKKKILEEVQSDVERGFIDTDKIEEILGGDKYTAWKNADAKESEMIEEYERLADTPSMELSRNQQKRLDELEAQIESLRSKPESTRLRGELSSSLSDQLKNSRLNESYNERVRRREKFVDDVSKYKSEAARKSIQNLIDAEYANNTNKVHDFADAVAKLAESSGKVFSFVNDAQIREMGKAVDGRKVNGFITEDGIAVNLDSARTWEFVVGHEVTHAFEKNNSYEALRDALKAHAVQRGEWDSRLAEMTKLYEGQDADVEAELTADLVGEYLFGDTEFINSLSTKNQNVFQKLYAEIKHLLKMVRAGSKQARQLEKAKHAFEKAMREGGKASVGTAYSLTKYSDHQKQNWKNSKRIVVYENNEQLAGFIQDSIDNKTMNKKMYFGAVSSDLASRIQTDTGLDVENYNLSLGSYEIRKILKDHGDEIKEAERGQRAITADDFSHIVDVVLNPTSIERSNKTYEGKPAIVFTGENNGRMNIVAVVSDKRLDLFVQTAYVNAKKENLATPIGEQAPINTPEANNGTVFSEDIIPQNFEKSSGETKFSLSADSEGRQLTEGQREYFKDSKVRDENGALKVMYHGTPNGDFTVFKDGTYFTENKWYADLYQNPGASSISYGKSVTNPKTYEVYLDIKKPFDISDPEARSIYINDYIKGGNAAGINPYLSDAEYDNINTIDWTEGEDLREFLKENDYDYDGLVLDEGATGGYGEDVKYRGKSYVIFDPSQVKNVDNVNPTDDPDIRRSLSRIGEGVVDQNAHMRLHPLEDVLPVREDVTDNNVGSNVQESAKDAQTATDEDVMPMPEAEQRIDLKYLMAEDDADASLPVREDTQAAAEAAAREGLEALTAPTTEAVADVTDTNVGDKVPTPETAEATPITTVGERLSAKKGNYETELESNRQNRANSRADYDEKITALQTEYNGLKKKDTKRANNLLRRIARLKRMQANVDADYAKRISDIEARIGRTDTELQKDHTRADNLERAYARIENELAKKKAALAESFAQRRAELTRQIGNRNAFISSEAGKLYDELTNLRKGVRASKDLGYLLDLGYDWKSLKAGLAHARQFPGRVVNTSSEVEAVVRDSLLESYKARTEELADLDNERSRAEAQLDMEAEIERDSARKAEDILRRSELHENYVNDMKAEFAAQGFDLDTVLRRAKNLSTFKTVDNTPQRVMQKSLGYKEGDILADITVNRVAQNETEAIKWLNSFTDRKDGVLAKLSRKYNIKPGSRKSMAAQMYAEGYYVNDQGEYVTYGDRELAADFPNVKVQENIKGLARDPIIRQIYDETLDAINDSRVRNAYPEIQRLNNYFLHFQAMDDAFSRLGIPFNPNDIKAKDLPTDINGMTADLKPGQPYFASAQHRKGIRTTFDLLGGLEKYLTSAKNQIYHIDDIQKLRALRNYIADDYGQAKGLESLDALTEEEAEAKIKQVFGSHLSTFAKFLNEEANILAGKTALIDRGLEGIIGRRGLTFIGDVNKQVGANQVGYNAGSPLTNFLAPVQAFAKMNKFDFVKGFTQTVANRLGSIIGKGDGFENSVMVRREGAQRFHRTAWQKMSDPGYVLMGAVDSISTEIIARAKYNELKRKNPTWTPEQAHFETDKWVSALMADRSLGQMPQIYNSKMLGLITKYQLEVRNQLDSQFYDTIQEAKLSNEEIESKLRRNAKTAAKVASTWFTLAVAQHVFGKAFESIVGYNPAFDIIEAISAALGWDDEEDSEDTVLDNIEEGFLTLLEDLPYSSLILDGGRIPISGALPIGQLVTGENEYGQEVSRWKTAREALPYYLMPGGYGQFKKTVAGVKMFDDDLPVSGSYTDKGALRFPVEKTPWNVAQAALFGQWASGNARDYFDNERKPLEEKQINEYIDSEMAIQEYWNYRAGLSGLKTLEEKADYINSLDIPLWKKNLFINNIADRKEEIDLEDYGEYGSLEEFDFANEYPEKYAFFKDNGISYEDYDSADKDTKSAYNWAAKDEDRYAFLEGEGIFLEDPSAFDSEEEKNAYTWAYKNPEKYTLSKAIADDVVTYKKYTGELYDIKADKDANGKSISGSRKEKVLDYINGLDADYGQKIILFKSEYNADDTYNYEIIEYLNGRDDISYSEMETILKELGFDVSADGDISW